MSASRRCRGLELALVLGLAMAMSAPAAAGARVRLPGEEMTPAGIRRDTAVYVPMRDGVEIAVDVWLPANHRAGDRWPALMKTTRYWRATELRWGMRLLLALGLRRQEQLVDEQREYFNRRGYVVLKVDARGSGASGGRRVVEYSPDEIADMGEVAAWAARQPWSNGKVATFGISYDGNTAELAAVPNQPAVRAVMPLYDDFDAQALLEPGGVLLRKFVQEWSDGVKALDRNDVCAASDEHGLSCWRIRQVASGVKPVDADPGGRHLAALVAQHHNIDVAAGVAPVEYRDDALVTANGTLRFQDLSPYGHRAQIEASGVPMMVWCGWMDANPCEGALIRYRTWSNPQQLVIGPLSHGGSFNADPFATAHKPPAPPLAEQYKMEADFFDRALSGDAGNPSGPRGPRDSSDSHDSNHAGDPGKPLASSIRYYTMGEGVWHTTRQWPPEGLQAERLYLAAGNGLAETPPADTAASDSYAVDFTASSGQQTRWHTQLGGGDVVYPDRAAADRRLLTYTGPPLAGDLEITGSPVLSLDLASTAGDGAVHAYLEDVSPDGRVTYLDEGVFRVIDRREVDPATLPYPPLGPAHSFLRRDAEPLQPGEVASVRFALFPTSIVLRKGHRIRLALAGADAGLFQRYPATGTVTWAVHRDRDHASYLELPVKPR
jgi:putative CocE/NonD family hydrolase